MRPAELLRAQGAADSSAPLLVHGDTAWTYGDVAAQAAVLSDGLAPGHAVGVFGGPRSLLVGLLAADQADARVYLLPEAPDESQIAELGLTAVVADDELKVLGAAKGLEPGVVVFTSGTTGTPKAALHTWSSIAARVRQGDALAGVPWLLPYTLRAYAGLQVLMHALANGGSAIVSTGSPRQAAVLAAEHGVRYLTGTPTFFRFLLSTAPREAMDALSVVQITLGGEAVDQALLDRLRSRFPDARISHLYASTELGACFSVHDARAGFPASWLDDPTRPVQLTVRDGELFVRSERGMSGYLSGGSADATDWFATGDHIAITGDRAHFVGRASERINVGGAKVYPGEVEAVLLAVPGVVGARVSGIKSSLAGQLVQAELVAQDGADPKSLRRAVLAHARENLAPYMVPRRLVWVDKLDQNAAGKLVRRTQ